MSTGSIGQTQIRMVQPGTPRIGQTTIRPTTPQIIRTSAPAMRPLTTIRGQTTIMQTNNQVPALHPVSGATIISGGAQVRIDSRILFSFFPPRRNFVAFLTGPRIFMFSACTSMLTLSGTLLFCFCYYFFWLSMTFELLFLFDAKICGMP